jgi:hypothetical protein
MYFRRQNQKEMMLKEASFNKPFPTKSRNREKPIDG